MEVERHEEVRERNSVEISPWLENRSTRVDSPLARTATKDP